MSETTIEKPTIVQVLSDVMNEVQSIGKDGYNQHSQYNFRGIDAVVNAVGPVFRKHGVVAVPMLESSGYRDVMTSKNKPSRECTLTVRYRFYGPAGDHIDAVVPGESMDTGDKGAAKAMSVAYRIALLQVLCIPTDDPDPDESTYERAPETLASQLEEQAKAAKNLESLKVVWKNVVAGHGAGMLTEDQYAALSALVTVRKKGMAA